MVANDGAGEETPMNEDDADLQAVERQLHEIRNRKRGRVRWNVSRHTAEMAIDAILPREKPARRSGKQRRRKRTKRLL